jgi:cyanophycin synthetase
MEFRKVLALRGPNIWANFPVLEAWVDLGLLKDSPSDELPGFNERLMAWLPTLVEHRCSVGERGGFFQRLRRGTYLAHILEHVTLELQSLAGTEVGYGRARETSEEGVYKVAVEYDDEELGRACLEAGRELCLAAVHGRPYDVEAELQKLRELARKVRPAPVTAAVVKAARARRIPVLRLGGAGLLQLGHGARQRRVLGGQTDRTGALAAAAARDNELTRTLLRAAGVPVPEGRPVAGAEDAWAAAQEVGTPVVVKPRHGYRRRGGRNLARREEVHAAYHAAASDASSLLVEKFAAGAEWRLLVVGERVVAAARRPGPNGGAEDVTDRVHREVAAQAIEAARAVGLDVAGIDVVADDISRPLEEQGGVVVAVVANPAFGLHGPSADALRPVAEALVAGLFPDGEMGRIPVAAVTGVNGKTTTSRLLAHIVARTGRCVGLTCTEGIYVGGRRAEAGDCSGPQSARAVLQNPRVEAAVLETARGGILRAGLGFDRCDVAVVTNIADGDHLGIADIDTPEKLARVKRTLVDVVAPAGAAVLKADDPLTAGMAEDCPGSVVFFARDGEHPVVMRHRAANGRAAFVRDGRIVLAEGGQEIPLLPLERVPLTHGGRVAFQVENALAAAAAAWALGVPCEVILAGLESFAADLERAPGRFNLVEVHGATVVLDYGHNAASLSCVLETLAAWPHARRTAVYGGVGDRRPDDLVRQGELLGDAFDRVLLYEEEGCMRGRQAGELNALMRRGLAAGGRVTDIEEVQGAVRAVEVALESVRPGELLLVQVDQVDATVELVRRYLARGEAAPVVDLNEVLAGAVAEAAAV